jgi:hypothetical protein
MDLSFLTPQLFDGLVIASIVIGVVWAAIRLRADFRRGPRFPEDQAKQTKSGEKP